MFITIETEQELLTPWMQELGGDLDPDISPFYAQRVQPGDRVIYKPESQMLIIHRANGTVYSLYRQTNLQADPDEQELSVNWFGHPTPQGETPSLTFENGECYPGCLDGPDKDKFFANFVKMATHEVFNPAGLFLKDGFYPSQALSIGDGFNISFGKSGQPLMFEVANPTERPRYNLAKRMVIQVNQGFTFEHHMSRDGDFIEPAVYDAEIRGWHSVTNKVTALRIESHKNFNRHCLDEDEFFKQAEVGNIEVLEVIEDEARHF